MLERYGHGGDLKSAEESYGLPMSDFVDFSSNMNPLGPPNAVQQTLRHYSNLIQHYPDPASRALRQRLAQKHHIELDAILVGNGAAELIDLAVRVLRPTVAGIAVPCFAEYGDAVHKIGASLYEGQLLASEGFVLNDRWVSEAMRASDPDLYLIGSPNNPTGQLVEPKVIERLLESGATVIVDEAFLDFVPEESSYTLIQEAAVNRKLFVLRSMTKFYSVPGIRLGYMVGHPEAIAELSRIQVPWSVNSLAQSIGEAVLEDEAFAAESIAWLQQERAYFIDALQKLGLQVCPSKTNYLLLRLPEALTITASELQHAMGMKGILIRDASRFPGLDERYIRVAVKLRADNEQLLEVLRKCLN